MRQWKIPGVSLGNPHVLYVMYYCKYCNSRYKLEATKMKVYKRTTLVNDHSSPWSTQVVSTHPYSSSSPLSSSSSLSSLSLTRPHSYSYTTTTYKELYPVAEGLRALCVNGYEISNLYSEA